MSQQTEPTGATPAPESGRELSDAELEGITGGVGGLIHEPVHSGTTTKPPPAPKKPSLEDQLAALNSRFRTR